QFIRFHTGARLVVSSAQALYAVISDTAGLLPLTDFALGTPEYPDRSATLILQVRELKTTGWKLEGPGICRHTQFSAFSLPANFTARIGATRRRFPCGFEMFSTTAAELAALPRSTRLTEAA